MAARKRATPTPAAAETTAPAYTILTSSLLRLDEGQAVVLLAAHPDPTRPGEYLLAATLVPEHPLTGSLRLQLHWQGGRRSARLDRTSMAHWRGIPAAAVEALRAGDQQALTLRLERATT